MSEEAMPMDKMEDPAPAPENTEQPPQQEQQQALERTRDESGRFAPRQQEEGERQPRGKPDAEMARRREAQERDEARREAQEAKQRYDALQKRIDDMLAAAKGEEAPPAEQDPIKALAEKVDGIGSKLTEREQAEQQQRAMDYVRQYADQDEARFTQQTPDFPNAVQHYITSRINEMQALGLGEEQITGVLQNEATTLMVQAAQQQKSPSEIIYTMAKARGYAAGQQPAQPQRQAPSNLGGRSFGTGAGPAASGGVTARDIESMSEEDYMAFRNSPEGKRAIQRLMGIAA